MENAGGEGGDGSIIVALGGNLAFEGRDPASTLEAALATLPCEGLRVLWRSRLWRSAAWPDASQPAFVNAVALVETELAPAAVLAVLHRVEARFGRVRSGDNAPRSLDLDLVAYGRMAQDADPVLPHPRASDRLFVMGPLAEIAPGWRHPLSGLSASTLAGLATVGRDAAPIRGRSGLQTRP